MKLTTRLSVTLLLLALLAACGTPTSAGLLLHTADPTLDLLIPWQPPGATVEEPQAACVIKANINRQGEKIYHLPGQLNYGRTVIDPEAGEMWFCSEEEAVAAGWRKALR